MSKHTPGPWYVDTEYPIQIMKHMEHWVGVAEYTDFAVANISEGAFTGEEELANTRLIAAAPKLLEALEELLGIYRCCRKKCLKGIRVLKKTSHEQKLR